MPDETIEELDTTTDDMVDDDDDDQDNVCDSCEEVIDDDEHVVVGERVYCRNCFDEIGFYCDACGEAELNEHAREQGAINTDGSYRSVRTLCSSCSDMLGLVECSACGYWFVPDDVLIDNAGDAFCLSSLTDDNYSDHFPAFLIFQAILRHEQREGLLRRFNRIYGEQAGGQQPQLGLGLNTTTKIYQSEEAGNIVSDKRGFSAEIECYSDSDNIGNIKTALAKNFGGSGLTNDQSLNQNGIEIQTPILAGKKGEEFIIGLTKMLVGYGVHVDKRAGLHIHLDGDGFSVQSLFPNGEVDQARIDFLFKLEAKGVFSNNQAVVERFRQLARPTNDSNWATYPNGRIMGVSDVLRAKYPKNASRRKYIDIMYLKNRSRQAELAPMLKTTIRDLERMMSVEQKEEWQVLLSDMTSLKLLPKIKNLFTAYYFADDFLMQVVPHSRRNSKYCRPLWKEFNIQAVDRLSNMVEFEKMWYQSDDLHLIGTKKSDKHDVSRRHGANFHILLCEGHFEIRYHSGTLNATKILRWVELHQAIMKLANRSAESFVKIRLMLEDIRFIQSLGLRRRAFYNLLGLSKEAREYWEGRAKKFTDDEKELEDFPDTADI